MSIERFEIGSVLVASATNSRIEISGNLRGLTFLNNIIPTGTLISLDDSAFQFEVFPYQTIEIPKEFQIQNSITIHVPNQTVDSANTTIQVDLPFKVLAFFDQDPIQIPVLRNIDVFTIRNDGTGVSFVKNMNFQNAMVYARPDSLAIVQGYKYQVGNDDIIGDIGYFMLRGDSDTNMKTLHFDFPFRDIRFTPKKVEIVDFNFVIGL